jgi:hypothetical protein
MEDVLGKLKEIESKLSRADAQVEWTGEALRELGSKLPDSRAWREIEDAISGAYGDVSILITQLEAREKAGLPA